MHRAKQSFGHVWGTPKTVVKTPEPVAPPPEPVPTEVQFDTKSFLETTFAKLEAKLESLQLQQNALSSDYNVLRKELHAQGEAQSQDRAQSRGREEEKAKAREEERMLAQEQHAKEGIRIPIWLGGLVLVVLTLLLVGLLFAVMRIKTLETHSQNLLRVVLKGYDS